MRDKLKKIVAYIFRSWEDEPGYPHPRLKILPPFLPITLGGETVSLPKPFNRTSRFTINRGEIISPLKSTKEFKFSITRFFL